MTEGGRQVRQAVTPEVIAEARALIAAADHGALAVLEPNTGQPLVSRIGLATLADGSVFFIASRLTAHSAALDADPRCSLLVGTPDKGDPLAHPRLSLVGRAQPIARDSAGAEAARQRYLDRHPKAAIYVDLPDFRFFRLVIERAGFNAGFGRAYLLTAGQLTGAA